MNQLTNKTIALIGPTGNATKLMKGNYCGNAPYLIDPFTAFKTIVEGNSSNYYKNEHRTDIFTSRSFN